MDTDHGVVIARVGVVGESRRGSGGTNGNVKTTVKMNYYKKPISSAPTPAGKSQNRV